VQATAEIGRCPDLPNGCVCDTTDAQKEAPANGSRVAPRSSLSANSAFGVRHEQNTLSGPPRHLASLTCGDCPILNLSKRRRLVTAQRPRSTKSHTYGITEADGGRLLCTQKFCDAPIWPALFASILRQRGLMCSSIDAGPRTFLVLVPRRTRNRVSSQKCNFASKGGQGRRYRFICHYPPLRLRNNRFLVGQATRPRQKADRQPPRSPTA
jgi:hypothetical protein